VLSYTRQCTGLGSSPQAFALFRPSPARLFSIWLTQLQHRSAMKVLDTSLCVLALLLADPVNIGVDHTHVSCQRIVTGEGFFFRAQMTTDLHLAAVVDSVLVPGKIIRPREDRVARLASAGIDAIASMGSGLRIAQGEVR